MADVACEVMFAAKARAAEIGVEHADGLSGQRQGECSAFAVLPTHVGGSASATIGHEVR